MIRQLVSQLKHRLLSAKWRQRGAVVGSGLKIYGAIPWVELSGPLSIGEGCTFRSGVLRSHLHVREGGEIRIGADSFINGGVEIQSQVSVTIGKNCLIGDDVVIQDTSFHEVDEGGSPKIAPISIGDNVWIARRAIILPGVTIGDHAVVGAGSIVTKDVPAKTVVAGNPARFVRDILATDNFRR